MTAIGAEERRLWPALRFLSAVSETLAAGFDVAITFERVADAAVPAVFGAIAIEAAARGLDPIRVARGQPLEQASIEQEMLARGTSLGTIRVSLADDRVIDEVDRIVLADLAARLAAVLDREALYAQEHRIASTLQRALLPERLPSSDRITCSAAYLPGVGDAVVGGDWYDVFPLGDGRTAFSVGDVAGHGLHAAVVMGEVRQAVRAAAVHPKACERVLERANTILNMRPDGVIVTAIFGIYNPADGRITYATAGHPPPIMALEDGTAYVLPGQGIPLGVSDSIGSRDWTFTLPAGALFVLYTDGLIEHSRDPVAGEAQLIDATRAEICSPSESPARGIVERIFAGRRNVDDVAVLALASNEQPAPDFSFDFPAVPLSVPIVRRTMARYAERQKLTAQQRHDLLTAVGEAVANAVEHAYAKEVAGTVEVRAVTDQTQVTVTVADTGTWKPNRRRETRGHGIRIMRAIAERVELRVGREQTVVHLTIKRASESI